MFTVYSRSVGGHKSYYSTIQAGRSHVVGIRKPDLADYVYRRLHPTAQPYLKHQNADDVSLELNSRLDNMGLAHLGVGELIMDIDAILIVPKHKTVLPENGIHEQYDKEELPASKFLMLPFEKRLGIVIPYDVSRETDTHMYLAAHAVDPCTNIEMFKLNLDI